MIKMQLKKNLASITNWHGFKRLGITERMNGVQGDLRFSCWKRWVVRLLTKII